MAFDPRLRSGIAETARALGMDPVDLATIISYETGGTFNPSQGGPTTKWGRHRGLIQFGEPQAREYGVDWNDPLGSQLGADGAVAKYFKASGYKPGMGLLDAYSTVNAGAPGLYNRSDAAAGGAPGTVRDKVENQMGPHRDKAIALMQSDPYAGMADGRKGNEAYVPPLEPPRMIEDRPMMAGVPEAQSTQQAADGKPPKGLFDLLKGAGEKLSDNPMLASLMGQPQAPQMAPMQQAPSNVPQLPDYVMQFLASRRIG